MARPPSSPRKATSSESRGPPWLRSATRYGTPSPLAAAVQPSAAAKSAAFSFLLIATSRRFTRFLRASGRICRDSILVKHLLGAPRVSVKVAGKPLVSDPIVAFIFRLAAPPALTSPTPPLPEGEEGIKKKLSLVFLPSLPRGERGRGSEGRRRGNVKKEDNGGDRRSEFKATLTEPCGAPAWFGRL